MKKCRHCMSEIDKKAKVCPVCKKELSSPIARIIVVVGMLFLLGVAVNYYFNNTDNIRSNFRKNVSDTIYSKNNFSHEITKTHGDYISYYIEGTAKNETSNEYSYVQIEFVCYDKNGVNIGTALDNATNIGAYESFKFSAMLLENKKNVDHCDFKEFTAW